ncbi:sugar-binding protein [Clostridium botulinum]|uniref:transglutaminase domain-containing protein n=1 Tax=Clostridium sp. CMCC3678 TaxID=2949962 RepID=UPI0013FCC144|nr:transglutaminase domain-containing protein [Clostridium sp. CMCC3678]NFK96761.1 sugar-binding protein [Clostridium botulinum]NFS62377.1 sugar-binding protein [Clostridium botulinum]
MKKRNQIISSLIAIALTTSITNTFAYADDKKTNDKVNTKTYNKELNELDEATLKLDQIKVTTGAAAFINPIENNDNDKIFKENDEESITIKTGARTLDEYLKSKLPKNNRRVKRYSSLSLFQSNKEDIKARLKDGMENYKTNIDIKDLIDLDDINNNSNKILDLYFDVIYENPQIFYCNPTSVKFDNCTYNPSTGKLNSCDIKVNYEYNNDVIDKMREKLNNKINYIKKNYLDECSTDLEIEYAIHDYITQNCTYDKDNYDKKTVPNISHTSYGALINQIAVCDGYSKATMLLLNEYGIEAGIVTNDSHAWNYVNIDGNYYQTDLTWDDPTPETNKITYKNFNCSDNVMRKIHPWTSTIPERCTDTTFDDLFRIINGNSVNGKNSVRIKDKLYYLDGTDLWKCNLDGSDKTLFSKNITQSANMVNLVTNDNDIYYLSELEIKKINTNDKKIDTFKNLSDEFNFTSGRYSVQFYIKNSKLNIRFGQSKNDSNLKFTTKEYELKATPEKSDDKPQNIVKVDKSNLITIYNHNKDKINGTFTDETWNTFLQSLNQAKNILDIDDATQLDINNALSNLQTSINNLKDKPKNIVKVDKSNLIAIYNHNKDKVKGIFTDETWNTFLQSLNQAKNILDRDDVTQLNINNALSNLQTSINNLKDKPKNIVKVDNVNHSSSGGSSGGGGCSTKKSSENKTSMLNEDNTAISTTKITDNNPSNLNIITTVKNFAQTLTAINNINKKISVDEIYEINNNNFNGTIANLKSNDNNYIYVSCTSTLGNSNINSLKIDANKLNSKEKYIYTLDAVTNKLIFINSVQDDLIEIQASNQVQYVLSDTLFQSLKNNDWNKVNNDWLYIENGHTVTGWIKTVDNNWYHMDGNGLMQKGWIQDNNKWYYLNQDGSMKTGWFKDISGNWYYLNPNGSMATNTNINGYYINQYGIWQ